MIFGLPPISAIWVLASSIYMAILVSYFIEGIRAQPVSARFIPRPVYLVWAIDSLIIAISMPFTFGSFSLPPLVVCSLFALWMFSTWWRYYSLPAEPKRKNKFTVVEADN